MKSSPPPVMVIFSKAIVSLVFILRSRLDSSSDGEVSSLSSGFIHANNGKRLFESFHETLSDAFASSLWHSVSS